MGKKFDISQLIKMRLELERASIVINQLKSLPNCYSCLQRNTCNFALVDDSKPSRYNCPLYEIDFSADIVENV